MLDQALQLDEVLPDADGVEAAQVVVVERVVADLEAQFEEPRQASPLPRPRSSGRTGSCSHSASRRGRSRGTRDRRPSGCPRRSPGSTFPASSTANWFGYPSSNVSTTGVRPARIGKCAAHEVDGAHGSHPHREETPQLLAEVRGRHVVLAGDPRLDPVVHHHRDRPRARWLAAPQGRGPPQPGAGRHAQGSTAFRRGRSQACRRSPRGFRAHARKRPHVGGPRTWSRRVRPRRERSRPRPCRRRSALVATAALEGARSWRSSCPRFPGGPAGLWNPRFPQVTASRLQSRSPTGSD